MAMNYDQTDPDRMRLPQGKTCGDCANFRHCGAFYARRATDDCCDFSPSRFRDQVAIDEAGAAEE